MLPRVGKSTPKQLASPGLTAATTFSPFLYAVKAVVALGSSARLEDDRDGSLTVTVKSWNPRVAWQTGEKTYAAAVEATGILTRGLV